MVEDVFQCFSSQEAFLPESMSFTAKLLQLPSDEVELLEKQAELQSIVDHAKESSISELHL